MKTTSLLLALAATGVVADWGDFESRSVDVDGDDYAYLVGGFLPALFGDTHSAWPLAPVDLTEASDLYICNTTKIAMEHPDGVPLLSCDESGRIVALRLDAAPVDDGEPPAIPPAVFNFEKLQELNFNFNDHTGLVGPIPDELFTSLTDLRVLDLTAKHLLLATIPTSVGQASKLEVLKLGAGEGHLPSELGLLSLTTFINHGWTDDKGTTSDKTDDTYHNIYSIPVEFWTPSLEHVWIDNGNNANPAGQGLVGIIPTTIGLATNLHFLNLKQNLMTGTVPSEILNCQKLTTLNLRDNCLGAGGPLPDLFSLPLLDTVDVLAQKNWVYDSHRKWPDYTGGGFVGGRIEGDYCVSGKLFAHTEKAADIAARSAMIRSSSDNGWSDQNTGDIFPYSTFDSYPKDLFAGCTDEAVAEFDLLDNSAVDSIDSLPDLSRWGAFKYLDISGHQESYLHASNVSMVTIAADATHVDISGSSLMDVVDLDEFLGHATALEHLGLGGQSQVDATNIVAALSTSLTALNLNGGGYGSVDLSANVNLETLDVSWNQLTALDVSANVALESLDASHNRLVDFPDFSTNVALDEVHLQYNFIGSESRVTPADLDFSGATGLSHLDVAQNYLVGDIGGFATAGTGTASVRISMQCMHGELEPLITAVESAGGSIDFSSVENFWGQNWNGGEAEGLGNVDCGAVEGCNSEPFGNIFEAVVNEKHVGPGRTLEGSDVKPSACRYANADDLDLDVSAALAAALVTYDWQANALKQYGQHPDDGAYTDGLLKLKTGRCLMEMGPKAREAKIAGGDVGGLWEFNSAGACVIPEHNVWGKTTCDENWNTLGINFEASYIDGEGVEQFDGNVLTGPLNPACGYLGSNIKHIRLINHELTGDIPTEWGLLTGLTELNLQDNDLLDGTVPEELKALTNLETLNLQGTAIAMEDIHADVLAIEGLAVFVGPPTVSPTAAPTAADVDGTGSDDESGTDDEANDDATTTAAATTASGDGATAKGEEDSASTLFAATAVLAAVVARLV